MKRRNQQQRAARAARRKVRRQRRRGGVASIMLGSNDGAVVFRASGRLQFHDSRAEPNPGTGAFWLHVLRWLFAGNEDAAERRQILIDDFMLDMQEYVAAKQKAAVEAEAKDRAERAALLQEPGMDDEHFEELVAELLPKHVAEVEAEAEEQRAKTAEAAKAREAVLADEADAAAQDAEDEELAHEAAKLKVGPNGECPICGNPHDLEAGCPGTPEGDGGPI